jgi:cyclopropane-fatty-acyl-phospholipid synthase
VKRCRGAAAGPIVVGMGGSAAEQVLGVLEHVIGGPAPVRVRAWDASEAGPPDAPALVLRRRRALRRLLWSPDELGLGRAYVSGDLDVEGDLYDALTRVLEARRPSGARPGGRLPLLRDLARLGALGPPPPLPPEEVHRPRGGLHTRSRDAVSVRHHYDVGNDFYRIVLGPSMVYSCAYWPEDRPDDGPGTVEPDHLVHPDDELDAGLDRAQHDKLELVCRKLGLRPGMRLLDVGCGWGAMLVHAARHHGVSAVGVTLSPEQEAYARERVAEAGLAERVEVRLQDYRDVDDGPYDAVCSIGMAEHVGREKLPVYAAGLHDLLAPGGRLLHHAIATHRPPDLPAPDGFVEHYVFPDGELVRLSDAVTVLEDAGFEVRDVQALREHYPRTLLAWSARLRREWDRAVDLVGEGRARVWLLYLTGSAATFTGNRIGVDQVLAVRPDGADSRMPWRRHW